MLTIKANLNSCVNDMTQQGKQALFEKYFQTTFTQEEFSINVRLSGDTYKLFKLCLRYQSADNDLPERILARLWLDNDDSQLSPIFKTDLTLTQTMTVLSGILCALHVCGDYIKFAFTGLVD